MRIINKLLPDFCSPQRRLKKVDGVIIHYFSARNADHKRAFYMDVCRDLLIDLNLARDERIRYMKGIKWPEVRMHASAHLLIGRSGEVWKLVEFDQQAYHAGASMLNNRKNCNRWTLGIELIGDQHSGFTREQYSALVDTLIHLENKFAFSRRNVAGHDSVRYEAILQNPERNYKYKYDPSGRKDGQGNNFDWFYLGKLWNDKKPNPEGVLGLEDLEIILNTDPLSQP